MNDLSHYQHNCGQPLLVGENFIGYQLRPTFHTEPGYRVTTCPHCRLRLNMNDCQFVGAVGATRCGRPRARPSAV